jgi:hypothetical protein
MTEKQNDHPFCDLKNIICFLLTPPPSSDFLMALSPREDRDCWTWRISGSHLRHYETCAEYPCPHMPTRDPDYLADKEEKWRNPFLHQLAKIAYTSRPVYDQCYRDLAGEFKEEFCESVWRKMRLSVKADMLTEGEQASHLRWALERWEFLIYWGSFGDRELDEYRRSASFNAAYLRYLELEGL